MRHLVRLVSTMPLLLGVVACEGHGPAAVEASPNTPQSLDGASAGVPRLTRFHAADFSVLLELRRPQITHRVDPSPRGPVRTTIYDGGSGNGAVITESRLPFGRAADLLTLANDAAASLHGQLVQTRSGPFHGSPGLAVRILTQYPTESAFLEIFQDGDRVFSILHVEPGDTTEPSPVLRQIVASFRLSA